MLISFYLKEKRFSNEHISKLKLLDDEKFWFQNYHLILYTSELRSNIDDSITKYLIPTGANTEIKQERYSVNDHHDVEINREWGLLISAWVFWARGWRRGARPVFCQAAGRLPCGRRLGRRRGFGSKSRREKWRVILQPLDDNKEPFDPCYIDQIASYVRIVEITEVSKHYE